MYRVPAGGRRFRALELLVVSRRSSRKANRCPASSAMATTSEEEDSLAENLQRQSLHPLDQFRAFQTLRDQGLGEEEIAAALLRRVATVKQRLRLASVSPRLLDLLRERRDEARAGHGVLDQQRPRSPGAGLGNGIPLACAGARTTSSGC